MKALLTTLFLVTAISQSFSDPTHHIKVIPRSDQKALVIRIDPGDLGRMDESDPASGKLPLDIATVFELANLHSKGLFSQSQEHEIVSLSIDRTTYFNKIIWFYTVQVIPRNGTARPWKEGRWFAIMPDKTIIDATLP